MTTVAEIEKAIQTLPEPDVKALAYVEKEEVLWVWIGHHAEYDHII